MLIWLLLISITTYFTKVLAEVEPQLGVFLIVESTGNKPGKVASPSAALDFTQLDLAHHLRSGRHTVFLNEC